MLGSQRCRDDGGVGRFVEPGFLEADRECFDGPIHLPRHTGDDRR